MERKNISWKKYGLLFAGVFVLLALLLIVLPRHGSWVAEWFFRSTIGVIGIKNTVVIAGTFLFEVFMIKKLADKKAAMRLCTYLVLVVSFMILMGERYSSEAIGFGSPVELEKTIAPKTSAFLTIDNMGSRPTGYMENWIVAQYYFADKTLLIPDNIEFDNVASGQYIREVTVPAERIKTVPAVKLDNFNADYVLAYAHHEFGGFIFVVDDFWADDDSIRMIEYGERYILCSNRLFEKQMTGIEDAVETGGEVVERISQKLKDKYPFIELKHFCIWVVLFVLGLLLCNILFGMERIYLNTFLSIPIITGIWAIGGVLYNILNIPYTFVSMMIFIVLVFGAAVVLAKPSKEVLDFKKMAGSIFWASVVIAVFACLKSSLMSYDSMVKYGFSVRLANYHTIRDIIVHAGPYGMLEIMVLSIGNMFHADVLLEYYPIMGVCCIGMLFSLFYYYSNHRQFNKEMYMLIAGGMILLLTHCDFALACFFVLAHGPVAVYFLLMIAFLCLGARSELRNDWIIVSVSAAVIITTRVEGAVYVLIIMALNLGLNQFKAMQKSLIISGAAIIIWNAALYFLHAHDNNGVFWTKSRGILLAASAIALYLIYKLIQINHVKIINVIKAHFYEIAVTVMTLAVAGACALFALTMTEENLRRFVSHFSNTVQADTQALAFWAFVILMMPLLRMVNPIRAKYAYSMIYLYLLSIFFVCAFRQGIPLRVGNYDSARRTIVQIMPAALWLILSDIPMSGSDRLSAECTSERGDVRYENK